MWPRFAVYAVSFSSISPHLYFFRFRGKLFVNPLRVFTWQVKFPLLLA
jgi:hypothetical protein